MTLDEIKGATDQDITICWKSDIYQVVKGACGQYLINCIQNDSAIGLTWSDGVTLNGKESEFYYL